MNPASDPGGGLDPASLAVLIARLTGIADEMGVVLRRSAISPNIKERADCSAAVFTATGELLVQAEHIPVHLGAMPLAVEAAIADCGEDVRAGEQIIVNDPFRGGTHLNDVTLVAPVHAASGARIGWVATRAHHNDVGGTAPGSMPPDATHIAEEGICISPRILDATTAREFAEASRTPDERHGDLAAQIGANRVGARRLTDLATEPFREVVDYGERRMRAALRAIPDGRHEFVDTLETGVGELAVTVVVTVTGDGIEFDFRGSAPQQRGNLNAVRAVTVSAVAFALRAATDPTIPANGGALRCVRVVTEPGTIVDAQFPAAVAAGNVEVSQRVADVCLGALAAFVPRRVGAAGQGTMNNVLLGGQLADGRAWVYYETIGGGQGARPGREGGIGPGREGGSGPGRDGMSGVHTAMTNTLDTPVEALERAYPLRVRRYSLRRGSGGAGEACGGDGIIKEIEVLTGATCTLITQRRVQGPYGLRGGERGQPGENWYLPGGDARGARRLDANCTLELRPGDVVRIVTPGGGGFGPVTG